MDSLRGLMILNQKLADIYMDISKRDFDDVIKAFFGEVSKNRKAFYFELKKELDKLESDHKSIRAINSGIEMNLLGIRKAIASKNVTALANEVRLIKTFSVYMYDDLLREISLPLALCKKLMKQRDAIQEKLNGVKRYEELVEN